MEEKVFVTGIGAVTPIGNNLEETWQAALDGRSGIRTLTQIDLQDMRVTIGGEIKDFDPRAFMSHSEMKRHDPYAWYGIAAAAEALNSAGCVNEDLSLDLDADRMGVTTATGYGPSSLNQNATRTLDADGPRSVPPTASVYGSPDVLGAHLSIKYGIRGASFALAAACATGTIALGEAMRTIRHRYLDSVLVVGAESPINRQDISSTANTRALTSRFNDDPEHASRPFDKDRSGFVIGAGAGAVLLESETSMKRGGRTPLAELIGYGTSTDAFHMTAPEPHGTGAVAAMRFAIDDAGIEPAELDYINAHGTSTELNDATELGAITEVLGDRSYEIPISSSKSMLGHSLGATGAVEAVLTVSMLNRGMVLPTINMENPAFPDYDLVPNSRRAALKTAMSNSFGFGGHNAAIVFRAVS